MNKLKKGDIITIVRDEMTRGNSIDVIMIPAPSIGGIEELAALKRMEVFNVEYHPFHPELEAEFGVKVGRYTLNGQKVTNINTENDEFMRLNLDIDIPYHGKAGKEHILDTYFLDEEEAMGIVQQFNEHELKRLEKAVDMINKAKDNMLEIVDKGLM